ncbi:hypothetical protein Ao3042_06816 [Aspergillus oryzae 3.042]|uniref:Uncharacterized protein n=1 Tax=Aspergillus oryzae (strain 3.042) TaxID=1160506 RepID=I8TRV5_ASPO3|nr:hypothetical protein Ao3042_06816 [Aspergillus oryzae 3.042]|eukprot:EIT77010.1 hypothetical protein Ao3042_06816 [Aspergillus oryzae 3.042]
MYCNYSATKLQDIVYALLRLSAETADKARLKPNYHYHCACISKFILCQDVAKDTYRCEGSSKSGYQQINIDYKNTAHSLGFPSQGGTQWTLQGSVEPIHPFIAKLRNDYLSVIMSTATHQTDRDMESGENSDSTLKDKMDLISVIYFYHHGKNLSVSQDLVIVAASSEGYQAANNMQYLLVYCGHSLLPVSEGVVKVTAANKRPDGTPESLPLTENGTKKAERNEGSCGVLIVQSSLLYAERPKRTWSIRQLVFSLTKSIFRPYIDLMWRTLLQRALNNG